MHLSAIAFHNLYQELNRDNRLFEDNNAAIGDDLLLPFSELKRIAEKRGITVATIPTFVPYAIDAYVFIDMPDPSSPPFRKALASNKPLYLIILESPLIRPQNYDPINHGYFRKIFTYNDAQVDGDRFIKLNYSFRLPQKISRDFAAKQKLCVMIAGNKRSQHPQELYDERLTAIHWFEQYHPADFDLYGFGWETGRVWRHLPEWVKGHWKNLGRIGAPNVPSYRGTVDRKHDVMGKYKFALCYENIRDVPGYITEKLFDALFAGTVPVYRGANNVTDHIPPECFIDLRQYPNYPSLYNYLNQMTEDRYLAYLADIEQFLKSQKAWQFTTEYFSETLLAEINRG